MHFSRHLWTTQGRKKKRNQKNKSGIVKWLDVHFRVHRGSITADSIKSFDRGSFIFVPDVQ